MDNFKKKRKVVKWTVNISEELNIKFNLLQDEQGKINKSKLMEYLLNSYLENNTNNE